MSGTLDLAFLGRAVKLNTQQPAYCLATTDQHGTLKTEVSAQRAELIQPAYLVWVYNKKRRVYARHDRSLRSL